MTDYAVVNPASGELVQSYPTISDDALREAITAAHDCTGANSCKGQGGCGNTAGINDCKGQGKCHVPLTTDTWKKARARFEARMKSENEEYGEAPSLIRKQSGNKQSGNSNGNKPSRKKKP